MSALDQLLREALGGSGSASEPVAPQASTLLEGVLELPPSVHRLTPQVQIPQRDPLRELRGRLPGQPAAQEGHP